MNKNYITAVFLLLVVFLAIFLVWPKYQYFQEVQEAIEKKEKELENKKAYFIDVREAYQALINYDDAFARILSALPKDPSVPAIFNYLQRTASESGLVLDEISFRSIVPYEKNPEKIKKIPLRLSLAGGYSEFKAFLSNIEESSRIFEAERIYFSSPTDPEESFSFRLELKTYGY